MNTVILSGRLTRDTELSNSQGGTGYLRNSLAVKSEFKNKDGEYSTNFFNFTAFGKTAEIIANYCSKGSLILVKGHLTNDKGVNCTTIELIVDNVELVESKKQQENADYNNNNSSNNAYYNNNNNNNFNNNDNDSPFKDVQSQFDINESDLPF